MACTFRVTWISSLPRHTRFCQGRQSLGFEATPGGPLSTPVLLHARVSDLAASSLDTLTRPRMAGPSVAYGVIQMVTATQCVMDRLAAFYFWKDRQALDQAIAVAGFHPIDLDAVRRWSQAEGQDASFDEFARIASRLIVSRACSGNGCDAAVFCPSLGCFRDIRWRVAVGGIFAGDPCCSDSRRRGRAAAAFAAERAPRRGRGPLDGPLAGRAANDARRPPRSQVQSASVNGTSSVVCTGWVSASCQSRKRTLHR